MRAVALVILIANAAFVGTEPSRVAAGRQPRASRVLDPVRDPPAGWRALRDRDTGVVVRMWGGALDAPGAMLDPRIAEHAARELLATHLELLAPGARVADFTLAANRVDGTQRTVAFHQTWNGLRVVGGQVHVVFAHDRLFFVGSDALPDVRAVAPLLARASPTRASSARAEAWLRDAVGSVAAARPTGERVVLPLVHGPGDIEYRIADVFDAARWALYVAPDGAPILRTSRVMFASGTLRFDVPDRRPSSTRSLVPAGRVNILADGVATTTADNGGFTWTGNLPATVDTSVLGTIVEVRTAVGASASALLVAQPGQPVDWSLASDELGDAQLTSYIHTMAAKARARAMHPTLAWLDLTQQVHVNENGECNAMSDGDAVHFNRAGAMCENTGRLADVVFHEFAHSFHVQSMIPGAGAFDSAMSEGISDFYAANITGDPGIGRGLFFDDVPLRDIAPLRVFPDDIDSDVHITGLILAGALWDLRQKFIADLGAAAGIALIEKLYVGILQRATDLPTAYLAALLVDDDDGDLGNGTPHGCAIEAEFARHGLVPDFATTTLAPPVVNGRDVTLLVTTPVTLCPRPQVATMTLLWHAGTEPAAIAMTPNGALWSATIPPQPDGTVVAYQIIAQLDDGKTIVFPDNPADPDYQLFVGDATPIWCERVDTDPSWVQSGAMGWEVAPPFGRGGDAPVSFTGVRILGTHILGDGLYPTSATTMIETPSIDASSFERVHVQFRRWLTVSDGTSDQATFAINGSVAWQNATAVDHVDKEWRFVDFEIAPSTDVKLAWTITADATRELGGWNLDDICVVGLGKIPRCGDGFVDVDEVCDDGNDSSGDGCTPDCIDEPDGGCCSSNGGAPGALLLGLGVFVIWRRRRH